MKTKYFRFIAALFSVVVCACSPDNLMDEVIIDVPPAMPEVGIMIAGGGSATRAAEPSQPGGCYADKLELCFYNYKTTGSLSSVGLVNLERSTVASVGVSSKNGKDKWATYTYNFDDEGGNLLGSMMHFFAIRGLAYTDADKDLFTYTEGDYASLPEMNIKVEDGENAGEKRSVTPELFYGHLWLGQHDDIPTITTVNDDFLWYSRSILYGGASLSVPITGKIYRIVSQINLILRDVPEGVDKMQLLCSNFPHHINLYSASKLGVFYPVSFAKTVNDCLGADVWTVVDEERRGEKTTLSTFLLPSESGSELKLRVFYKDGRTIDFDVRPSNSVHLTGVSDVYTGVSSLLQLDGSPGDFYIYNNTTYRFYSYSNVRVNIRVPLDNIAVETQIVDVEIEVEPSFESKHEFNVI